MAEDKLTWLELAQEDWTLTLTRLDSGLHLRIWDEEGVLDDRVLEHPFTKEFEALFSKHKGVHEPKPHVRCRWSSGATCALHPSPLTSPLSPLLVRLVLDFGPQAPLRYTSQHLATFVYRSLFLSVFVGATSMMGLFTLIGFPIVGLKVGGAMLGVGALLLVLFAGLESWDVRCRVARVLGDL